VTFIHDDPEFADLIRIVGAERTPSMAPPLVEKDYWVTHALWCVQRLGLECWFKGGTSLSKGFGLIHRFSEDFDLKLGPGSAAGVPEVSSWKSEAKKHVTARREFFEAVARKLDVPGAKVELHAVDDRWRSAELRVLYPSVVGEPLPAPMKPFVVIEAGSARVVPHVECELSSFVHEGLERRGMLSEFEDSRPRAVRCVHPLVTLIEKLEAIGRRFHDEGRDAAGFVRHYEDAARIIEALDRLPQVEGGAPALLAEMLASKEIKGRLSPEDASLTPSESDRWRQVHKAYDATERLFFGPRVGLDDACQRARAWLASLAVE
jgi:hypothetical protein